MSETAIVEGLREIGKKIAFLYAVKNIYVRQGKLSPAFLVHNEGALIWITRQIQQLMKLESFMEL